MEITPSFHHFHPFKDPPLIKPRTRLSIIQYYSMKPGTAQFTGYLHHRKAVDINIAASPLTLCLGYMMVCFFLICVLFQKLKTPAPLKNCLWGVMPSFLSHCLQLHYYINSLREGKHSNGACVQDKTGNYL